jgi:hypothetical protein
MEMEIKAVRPTLERFQPLKWYEWKTRWELTTDPDALVGLLHGVFETKVESSDRAERLCFVLRVADKFEVTMKNDLQQIHGKHIADKAFRVLAQHYFKEHAGKFYWRPDGPQELYETLLWFFRPNGGCWSGRGLYSLDRDDKFAVQVAGEFVDSLVTDVWGSLTYFCEEWDNHIRIAVMDIADARGKLWELLNDKMRYPSWHYISPAVMEKLKQMALSHPGRQNQYTSIEEAMVGGCEAAQLYHVCCVAHKEVARQRKLAELEKQREQLAREEAQLKRSS